MPPRPRSRWDEVKDTQAAENERVINEFRANEGRVERYKFTVLLLHHTGAKSGIERISPLNCMPVGNNYAIFGTKAGAPTNPDWYHNLLAHPRTTVEIGTEKFEVVARVTVGEERNWIWEEHKRRQPGFANIDQRTDREFPVILLERH